MAKDQKPAEELTVAKLTVEQARSVVDVYFDTLQKMVSSVPYTGMAFGETLRSYVEKNISTTHEYVKRLSHAKDFQEIIQIQMEFVQSTMNSLGQQTTSLAEEYTKSAADMLKKPIGGTS